MKYKYLVADIHGTIVDCMPAYTNSFVAALIPFGIDRNAGAKVYESSLGTPLIDQFRLAFLKFNVSISEAELLYLSDKTRIIIEKIEAPLFDEAKETLEKIKQMGMILCATSGTSTEKLKHTFKRTGIDIFDLTLGTSADMPKGDKHIEFFASFFKKPLEQFARESAFIGDGPTDMRIAKRIGIFSIGVTYTVSASELRDAGADIVIDRIEDIIPLLA